MKKSIFLAIFAAFAMMATSMLTTSCGDDDPTPDPTPTPTPTPGSTKKPASQVTSGTLYKYIAVSKEGNEHVSITAQVTDANGTVQDIDVTSSTCQQSDIKSSELSMEYSMWLKTKFGSVSEGEEKMNLYRVAIPVTRIPCTLSYAITFAPKNIVEGAKYNFARCIFDELVSDGAGYTASIFVGAAAQGVKADKFADFCASINKPLTGTFNFAINTDSSSNTEFALTKVNTAE